MKKPENRALSRFAACWLLLAGLVMSAHFCYVAVRSVAEGRPGEMLWITHIFTLTGGLGALFKSRRMVAFSLTALFLNHAFWTADALTYFATGRFPFGFAAYIKGQSPGVWIQSANHLFDLPLLIPSAYFLGGVPRRSWISSGAISTALVVFCYLFTAPAENVNCVFAAWPGMDRLYPAFLLSFSGVRHVAVVIAVTVFFNQLPVNLVLSLLFSAIGRKKAKDRPRPRR